MLDNENIKGADELIRKLKEAERYIKNDIPRIIGNEAVSHFKKSFLNEGFTDSNTSKWAPRAKKRKGGTNSQKVLNKSGELGDAFDYKIEGNTIIITNDKPYAKVHNEGFDGTQAVPDHERKGKPVKAHSRHMKMPKRQFMGNSQALNEKIETEITKDLTKILR